jgi:hypothetical protein
VVHLRYMARIIIPKTLAGSDDLVIIPKKEFDDLSARAESAVGAHFDDYLARRLLGIAGLARRNNAVGGEFNYDLGSSVIGGGTLGCNWQGASPFVFGIEGEGGYSPLPSSAW